MGNFNEKNLKFYLDDKDEANLLKNYTFLPHNVDIAK